MLHRDYLFEGVCLTVVILAPSASVLGLNRPAVDCFRLIHWIGLRTPFVLDQCWLLLDCTVLPVTL